MKGVTEWQQQRISTVAKLEGNFLESVLPVRAFATLTTQVRLPQYKIDESFSAWIRGVQAHNRVTVGWIRSYENDPQLHIHAALVAASPLDCIHAEQLWKSIAAPRYSRAAKIKRYRDAICGLGYIVKLLDQSAENIQFSPNLNAFTSNLKPISSTNSAQRRQSRRIAEQLEVWSCGKVVQDLNLLLS